MRARVQKNNTKRELVIALLRPIQAVVFLMRVIDKVLFSWWLDIWLQRRENAALRDDIQANLYFLYSTGEIVEEPWLRTAVHPFDYAVVRILNGNICFGFTRGQEQLNVRLSPRHAPRDTHELHIVVAAIDSTDVREQKRAEYLSDVADLLQPRMDALNEAFSESGYPAFKEKMSNIDRDLEVVRREAQWELNNRLYPLGRR
jgi:hypothetical protein